MTNSTDVFLSHNWGTDEEGRDNHERVALINEALNKLGYCTWFDEEDLTGDIDDKIAKGIEQTKCVIVFMTQKYLEKVNGGNATDFCQIEFCHASNVKTKDKMVAVIMEPCMTGGEWIGRVGLYLNRKMFIDMSDNVKDENYLMEKMKSLQKELRAMGIQPTSVTKNMRIKKNKENKENQSGTLEFTFYFVSQFHCIDKMHFKFLLSLVL